MVLDDLIDDGGSDCEEILGLCVNTRIAFSNHKGVYKKGIEKRQRKHLENIGYIKPFLDDGEQILLVTNGCSPMSPRAAANISASPESSCACSTHGPRSRASSWASCGQRTPGWSSIPWCTRTSSSPKRPIAASRSPSTHRTAAERRNTRRSPSSS